MLFTPLQDVHIALNELNGKVDTVNCSLVSAMANAFNKNTQ